MIVDLFSMQYSRLEPGVLEKSLQTRRFGKRVAYYEEASSTNVLAAAIARAGCPEGEVVMAESQAGGKGRLGRSWDSPAGRNLYLSMVVRPRMAPAEAAQLTLLAAVAVADTLCGFVASEPRIKWPNDVLLRGRKASGILCELATQEDRVDFVIVGIGVNLNYPRHEMPPEIRETATSVLEESGQEVDRSQFAKRLIEHFEARYFGVAESGFQTVARAWNEYARIDGQWMLVKRVGERDVVGRARGLDDNGFLLLEHAEGSVETILSGDVSLLGGRPKGA